MIAATARMSQFVASWPNLSPYAYSSGPQGDLSTTGHCRHSCCRIPIQPWLSDLVAQLFFLDVGALISVSSGQPDARELPVLERILEPNAQISWLACFFRLLSPERGLGPQDLLEGSVLVGVEVSDIAKDRQPASFRSAAASLPPQCRKPGPDWRIHPSNVHTELKST